MTDSTPARDFLKPALEALIHDAGQQGIAKDVAVAVMIDLVTGPGFNDTPLDPAEDTEPARDPEQVATAMDQSATTEWVERREDQVLHESDVVGDAGRHSFVQRHIGLSRV